MVHTTFSRLPRLLSSLPVSSQSHQSLLFHCESEKTAQSCDPNFKVNLNLSESNFIFSHTSFVFFPHCVFQSLLSLSLSLCLYAHKLELSSNCSPGRIHSALLLFVIFERRLPHLRLTQLSLEIFEHLIFTSFSETYRRLALCLYLCSHSGGSMFW